MALAEAESWYRLRGLAEPMPIGLPSATRRGWRERGRVALAVAGAVVCVLAVVVAYVLVVRQLSDLPL
ncbi:hypothetical protein PA7_06110 [Pseudonocardia asaccharolytica DSM 44247 = NBRC 16224]|uniref:Uncharacterized protein n=1 Tax=Pseudonocardia asaccharolytica DSM 44247 = NBRC 16224 TaxID=1123024 RepID=A0A511CZS1_9PSEU|nr:hypothetical protein PA7_06110 [Pseudonocardia asaccharolytica DSM 44247 = NBRC 16224]